MLEGASWTARQELCDRLLSTSEDILRAASERLIAILSTSEDTYQRTMFHLLCPTAQLPEPILSRFHSDLVDGPVAIALIVWGMMDSRTAKATLRIGSIADVSDVLTAASSFEREYGDVSTSSPCHVEQFTKCVF